MSCGWISKCAHVSHVHLIGESCDHGIAFGSPVVPEENSILVRASEG
jgi:hypothetical protein